jgi:cell fate (sporulation/competence/biofilm development) regulator YlbF (YheA/YmcA/DUF963 family)
MRKNLTRERLLDLACQLEGIIKELSEASEAPAPRSARQREREQRVAYHFNKIQSKIEAKKRMV